jgi:hypothetical protein
MGRVLLAVAVLVLAAGSVQAATTIDFESGFSDQQAVGTVVVADNSLTFTVGDSLAARGPAYVAEVGGPKTAFVGYGGGIDTTEDLGVSGDFFLTDEELVSQSFSKNYYIEFARAVSSLSLDLYDFCGDAGGGAGAMATLTAYSDSFATSVGTDTYTVPTPLPNEGNIVSLAVAGDLRIVSASVTFSTADTGTGIDNIQFSTIPAPAAVVLASMGAGLVGWLRRRRSL